MVYPALILATCPHSVEACSALASSLSERKIRVRSGCRRVRHASELPRTDRSDEMDCVATIGITRHCRVSAKGFLVAARVVLADAGERLILVAQKDGRPDVPARRCLHLRRPEEERLQPRILEHDADGAGERGIGAGGHVEGEHLPVVDELIERRKRLGERPGRERRGQKTRATDGRSNLDKKTDTPSTMLDRILVVEGVPVVDVPAVHGFDAEPDLLRRLTRGAFEAICDVVLLEDATRASRASSCRPDRQVLPLPCVHVV